ncbi:hypothetical protein VNI00_016402 [Paramarasmius palmivorus]|uniref:Uncharacterized protein n=1 Tax=Paramarasmius palmivorus TaxID=297713 RepID=A0AAW0BGS2_9AGAR
MPDMPNHDEDSLGVMAGSLIDSMLLYGIAAQQLPTSYGAETRQNIIDSITQKMGRSWPLNMDSGCSDCMCEDYWIEAPDRLSFQYFPRVTSRSKAVLLDIRFCAQAYGDYVQPSFATEARSTATTLEFLGGLDPPVAVALWYKSDNCSRFSVQTEEMGQSIYLEGNMTMSWATGLYDETSLRERIVKTITELNKWHDAGEFDAIAATFDGHDNAPWSVISLNFGELIFSLSVASQRLPASSDMQAYIEAYISHQYNILLDNITSTNQAYSDWNNTNSSEMDIKRRLSISYMLLAGIGMPETTQGNDTSQTENPPRLSETQSRAPVGPIVGGSIGAVILIAILISSCVLYNRRRPRNQSEPSQNNTVPEPFTLEISQKQLVTANNAPRDWQLKDRSGRNWVGDGESTDTADVAAPGNRRYSSPATLVPVQEPISASVNQADQERDHDSGWRPSGAHRRLPPTYEDAM